MSPTLTAPALHFLVLDFAYACGVNSITFTCTTDTPCHLTAHVSYDLPRIRRIPYQKRGAQFVLSSVTCFVEVITIEQTELADTTTHTFTITPTDYDHTYYWYLTGTQGGVPCKSISQIFWHMCPTPTIMPVTVNIPSASGCSKPTVDGYMRRQVSSETWATIRAGAGTAADCGETQVTAGWQTGSTSGRYKYMSRCKITHDLASIPAGSTILSVKYSAVISSHTTGGGNVPAIGLYSDTFPAYTGPAASDYQKCLDDPIADPIQWADMVNGQRYDIEIYPAYLSLFQPTLKSKFSIREANYEAPNHVPTWSSYQNVLLRFHSMESLTVAYRPYLIVTYLPPSP